MKDLGAAPPNLSRNVSPQESYPPVSEPAWLGNPKNWHFNGKIHGVNREVFQQTMFDYQRILALNIFNFLDQQFKYEKV